MKLILTDEQNNIIDLALYHYESEDPILIKVEAVAGAAKTTTAVELTEQMPNDCHNLYLAYNKSIATEADMKFPKNTECKTTHSLAYNAIITHGLNMDGTTGKSRTVGWFGAREIKEKITYSTKQAIIESLEGFFLSRFTKLEDYFTEEGEYRTDSEVFFYANQYFEMMINKEIDVTHAFYLKLFHILLVDGIINFDTYDCLILDEAGDVNGVTLEIFLALPATVKLMIGDSQQNIYSFNHTINAFKVLENVGVTKHLTQSFRCSERIASIVERFSKHELDDEMVFRGVKHDNCAISTTAYLTRTNSGLLNYIIQFMQKGKLFNLVRNPNEIFKVVLSVLAANNGKEVRDVKYKFLEWDVKEFNKSKLLQLEYKQSPLKYLLALHRQDPEVQTAITTIFKYGGKNIWDAFQYAKKMFDNKKTIVPIYLTTVHSSKGLTFDEVVIGEDFNVVDILHTDYEHRENEEQEELRLAYVAMTRARISIRNYEQFFDFKE